MNILSLDCSTRAIGYAFWNGKELFKHGSVQAPNNPSVPFRLRIMKKALKEILFPLGFGIRQYVEEYELTKKGKIKKANCHPKCIFLIEDTFVRGKYPTIQLGKARGMVEDLLLHCYHPYEKQMVRYLLPSEWKSAAFGKQKGASDKELIMKQIKDYGYDVQTEDEADAIGLILGYFNMKGVVQYEKNPDSDF